MILKSFRVFSFEGDLPDDLASKVQSSPLVSLTDYQHKHLGWVSPDSEESSPGVVECLGYIWLVLGKEEKKIPAAVIKRELMKKVKKLGLGKLSSKDKVKFKDEVINELLPKVLPSYSSTDIIIDRESKRMYLGTTSNNAVEEVMESLHALFDGTSVTFSQVLPEKTLSVEYASWLRDGSPSPFTLGYSCTMKGEESSQVQCKNLDLDSTEVLSHLNNGMRVEKLALELEDEIMQSTFVIDTDFQISGFKPGFSGGADSDDELEDSADRLQASLALEGDALKTVVDNLLSVLD